ncbi:MAG: hypothetical protein WA477_18195 [Candidatus Sulfotelmatobacter sp.]
MAGKEMVTKGTRERIGALLGQLAQEKGKLRLAMLAQSSTDLPGRWSLVVTAPWMDAEGPRAAIGDLTDRLLKSLDKKELAAIDRVSVLSMADPFVGQIIELLNDFLGVDVSTFADGFYVSNSQVQDWDLPQAFVFVADPSVKSRPQKLNGTRRRASAR